MTSKFQKKEAPTLRRCKKNICNSKGKIYLQKVKSAHKGGLVSFLFLKKWRNHPSINSKRLKTFSFMSHSLLITKLPRLKKQKISFPRRNWPKIEGVAHRRIALRVGQSTRKSPKFSQNSRFLLSNSLKLLSKAGERVSTSFPCIFVFPFAFHVNNFSS